MIIADLMKVCFQNHTKISDLDKLDKALYSLSLHLIVLPSEYVFYKLREDKSFS